MNLSIWDFAIVLIYVVGVLVLGFLLSRKSNTSLEAYFLGSRRLPWYYLGNASGMFDISGTIWTVGILFVYGLKSAWLPWLWPVWNQVFVFVFLAIWMRRSNVMTGAEWISFRFGEGRGAKLSYIIIAIFAVISVLGFIAYFFEGIGKYCTSVLPWDLSFELLGYSLSSERSYALVICGLTSIYTVKGGMHSVVATKNTAEAAKMSFLTICVLYLPRYFMIMGFAVMALVYLGPEMNAMGDTLDFEQILPMAMEKFLPVGLKGLMMAGFLAAFMGTFAYVVNDIYKKYINPKASNKKLVRLSVLSSLALVMVGIVFGFNANSLNSLILWLSSALYGGYVAANILKWIWWRFSGNGYFWGMLFGLTASTTKLFFFPEYVDIFVFPIIFVFSFLGCIMGTYVQPLPNRDVVKQFYRQTRPWGFWGPIKREVMAEDPDFVPNQGLGRDTFSVVVGIIWQLAQVVLPMYLFLKKYNQLFIWSLVLIITSVLLKRYWWNPLKQLK